MPIKLSKPFGSNRAADDYDTRQMKKSLNRLGYYMPYEKTGITGIPDDAVFVAFKAFQKDHGIEATGTAYPDDETVKALNSETAKKPSGQYIWQSVGDSKVRDSHAALNGTIRDFADSPDPGEEYNCRCWAEAVKDNCEKERQAVTDAQKDVKELSRKFNDLLLELDRLERENNELIKNAQIALGAEIVAYILTLPFSKLGTLNELLRRYFGNMISNELLQGADRFMRQIWAVKEKAKYILDQIAIARSMLENAAKKLENSKRKLEECKKNEEKTR